MAAKEKNKKHDDAEHAKKKAFFQKHGLDDEAIKGLVGATKASYTREQSGKKVIAWCKSLPKAS